MPRKKVSTPAVPCAAEGCDRQSARQSFCDMHYKRWKRHGDPLAGGKARGVFQGGAAGKAGVLCEVEGCDGPVYNRNMCNKHYIRWRKHGDPLAGKPGKAVSGQTLLHCGKTQCPAAKRINTHLHFLRNSDDYRQRARINYHADVERSRQIGREYYATHRQEGLERTKQWKRDNPERYRANNARNLAAYREYIRQATPPWTDLAAIDAVYMAAPKGYHVDHIVPIRGEFVCGLHVHWNMQYLPESENCSKRNTFTEADGIDRTAPGWPV